MTALSTNFESVEGELLYFLFVHKLDPIDEALRTPGLLEPNLHDRDLVLFTFDDPQDGVPGSVHAPAPQTQLPALLLRVLPEEHTLDSTEDLELD